MILALAEIKDSARSDVLARLAKALRDIANERRGFEQSVIRQGLHDRWSVAGESDYRVLIAVCELLDLLLLGTRGVVKAKQPVPLWVEKLIDEARKSFLADIPEAGSADAA